MPRKAALEPTLTLEDLPGHRVRAVVRQIMINANFGLMDEGYRPPGYVPPEMIGQRTSEEGITYTEYKPMWFGKPFFAERGYSDSILVHGTYLKLRVDFPPKLGQVRECLAIAAEMPHHWLGSSVALSSEPELDRRLSKGKRSPRRKARDELITELGPLCHCCGKVSAVYLDHDHISNLIRGVICRVCNAQADHCLHVRDCLYADYLNKPPALKYLMKYKHKQAKSNGDRLWTEYMATPEGRAFYAATTPFKH